MRPACARWLVMVLALGCSRPAPGLGAGPVWVPAAAPALGDIVARVGEVPVFAAEVAEQARRTGRSPREALETLIAFNLLAERARAGGLVPADLDVRPMLVQRLLERDFEPGTVVANVPEPEIRRWYQGDLKTYVHPRLVEIVILSSYLGGRVPEKRAEARAIGQELAEAVARRPVRTGEDLQALAAEPAWSSRIAVARLHQGPDKPFSAKVGEAVMRLQKPGDTTPLIEDAVGFHIARYVGERAPRSVGFAEAREELLRRYHAPWQKVKFGELTGRLIAAQRPEVFRDRLVAPAP